MHLNYESPADDTIRSGHSVSALLPDLIRDIRLFEHLERNKQRCSQNPKF